MTDLDDKVKKTCEDVEKLKSQIGNILQTLIANKDLFESEADVAPILPPARKALPPAGPPAPVSKPSNLLSKLSRNHKVPPPKPQPPLGNGGNGNSTARDNDSRRDSTTTGTGSVVQHQHQLQLEGKKLQMWLPTYICLESETFLLPLLDRWIWGTTIINSSRIAEFYPELTLSTLETCSSSKSPFSYKCTIALVDSEWDTTGRVTPAVVDIPFQQSFGLRENQGNRIQPGCRATITATFEIPINSWSIGNGIEILANLTLRGRFQWSQRINLPLTDFSVFKDDIYKRFQPQIFGAMTQCQNMLKIERRLSQGKPSLSNAFKHFLASLGFQRIHSVRTETHVSLNSYGCDIPASLFGAAVRVEENDADFTNSFRCSLTTRSHTQMQCLLSLLSTWIQTDSGGGKSSHKRIHISSLSSPTATVEEKRVTLLAEIETLTHLLVLDNRNVLDSDHVVQNWIKAYARVAEASDRAFRS